MTPAHASMRQIVIGLRHEMHSCDKRKTSDTGRASECGLHLPEMPALSDNASAGMDYEVYLGTQKQLIYLLRYTNVQRSDAARKVELIKRTSEKFLKKIKEKYGSEAKVYIVRRVR